MAIKKPDLLSGTAQKRAVQRASEAGKAQAAKVQASGSSGGEVKKPVLKTWFSDTRNIDQVVDSFTGQVIQVDKPAAIGGTVKGAVKSTAAGLTNLGGTLLDLVNRGVDTAEHYSSDYAARQVQNTQEMLRTGRTTDGKAITPAMRETLEANLQKYQQQAQEGPTGSFQARHPVLSSVQEGAQDLADDLATSAQKDIDQAKEGLGTLGQFAVDAGVAGTQLAGDIGLGLLTGGSALIPMALRSFGSGAQEARQSGADLGEQVAYGLGSAVLSTATEKISNVAAPFRKAFGSGAADDLARKLVSRFGENTAVQTMNRLSQTAAGRLAASALGEGSEEFAEAVFQPVLQRATYDPQARFNMSQAIYDAAVGAVLGGIGGAVDVGTRRVETENAAPETEAAVNTIKGKTRTTRDTMPGTRGAVPVINAQSEPSQSLSYSDSTISQGADGVNEGQVDPRDVDLVANLLNGVQTEQTAPGVTEKAVQPPSAKVNYNALEAQAIRRDAKTFRNLVAGFDTKVSDFFKKWRGGRVSQNGDLLEKLYLGRMPEAVRRQVSSILGYEVEQRDFIVTNDDVKHVFDHHGDAGAEIKGNNIPLEQWMFDALPDVVTKPDTIEPGKIGKGKKNAGKQSVIFRKAFPGGTVVTVQFDNKGRGTMEINTLYAKKNEDTTSKLDTATGAAPNSTSKTLEPVSSFDSTIPQGSDTVKNSQPARGSGALDKLGVYIEDDQGDYARSMWIRGSEEAKKRTEKARRQAEKRLNPTKAEKRFAHGIAEGDYTVADIPASMDRETVEELADYYTAENSFKSADSVNQRRQQIRQQNEDLARSLIGEPEDYHPIPMLLMNEKTPERVMQRLFGDRQGEQMNQTYIYPVQQNEAEKLRFVNRMLDQVRTVQDSTGKQSPLTRQERSVVQQMLEDRFVGETVASMETAESIRNAAINIKNGKDVGDSAKEFSLRGEEVDLAQQLARWMGNQELIQSGQLDGVKIQNAVDAYSKQYDLFYDAINDFLTAHGYSTIGFIKGYAPHMQEEVTKNKLSSALSALGVNPDAMQLPTSISGLTANYKPGMRFNPFAQHRRGNNTVYDVAEGYEKYVEHLADVLYHTDDIARLRGLSQHLRKTYGGEEIADAIDHAEGLRTLDSASQLEALREAGLIEKGSVLTPQDTRARLEQHIDKLYDEIGHMTRYGEFVKYIDDYANILAGKQSMADRGQEYVAGRASLNAGNRLVSAFSKAQVAGNLSSALNQSAQLPLLLAEVDGKSVAKAVASLVKSTGGKLWNMRATDLFDQSDLLTTKKGIDYLTDKDTPLDRYVDTLFKPLELTDSLLSALTVQSKYEQLRSQGLSHEVAMDEASRFAQSIMGSRAKGSKPMAYTHKGIISQMVHMFQLEAVNSWDHISQDLPRQIRQVAAEHGKQAAGRAVATMAVKGLLSAFILNRITEAAYGGTPAPFDVLGYVANFVASGKGMSTNAWLAELVNAGWEKLFGEALFGDDDDREEEEKSFNLGQATDDLVYNLLNDIPFVRNAAGLIGWGDQTMPLANIAEAAKGVKEAAGNSGILSSEMGGALLELGSTVLPGGRQLQKTGQGIWTSLNQGRVYGFGDEMRLQYPVERDPFNIVQAVLFGNSGLAESRDFYASGNTGLSAKQTQLVNDMGDAGADRMAVYDAIQDIRNSADAEEKLQALSRADLSDGEKLQVFAGVMAGADSQHTQDIRSLLNLGIGWDQIAETYPIDSASAAWRYTGYIESGLSPEDAGGLSAEMEDLEPESGKDSVTDLQRYRAVVDYGLSQQEQLTVLRDMMEDSEYENLMSAYQKGIAPEQFITFREGISGLSADKNLAGKTISGSKKRKVLAYIDNMDLNNAQKTALYYAAGYAASTISDAPWYGRPEDRWNIIPRLDG